MKTCTTDRSDSPVLVANRLDLPICCVAVVAAVDVGRTVAGRADEVRAGAAETEPTPLSPLTPKGRPILAAHCYSIQAILDY